MQKNYEDANDQHIRNITVYGKAADTKIYADAEYTTFIEANKVAELFAKNMLVVKVGNDLFIPVAFASSKIVTVSVSSGSAAVTEWTVATEG